MEETKYGKYIVSKYMASTSKFREGFSSPVTYIDSNFVEGAFYAECVWFHKASEGSPPEHTHEDFDEILMFFGSDPENPHDLCGEIELWLGDEKHMITESCIVYIPKGLKHCPMYFRRVDRPIIHLSTAPSRNYSRDNNKENKE